LHLVLLDDRATVRVREHHRYLQNHGDETLEAEVEIVLVEGALYDSASHTVVNQVVKEHSEGSSLNFGLAIAESGF